MNLFSKIRKLIFLALMITLVFTYFSRKNYRKVDDIDPEVLEKPIQKELYESEKKNIEFEKDGVKYQLEPLYQYEINGLIVHEMTYDNWYSMSKRDSIFPKDFCMIWGSNVENKSYQNKDLSFSQDMRFCLWNYTGHVKFDNSEISNSHILTNDKEFNKKAKSLMPGDQVKIEGKLVNVKETDKEDPLYSSEIQSSTDREDTGAGACEVILVEDIELLKKGNPTSHALYTTSFYGLIGFILFNLIYFFISINRKKQY